MQNEICHERKSNGLNAHSLGSAHLHMLMLIIVIYKIHLYVWCKNPLEISIQQQHLCGKRCTVIGCSIKIATKRDLTVHTDEELRILLSMTVDVEVWDKFTHAANPFVQPIKI